MKKNFNYQKNLILISLFAGLAIFPGCSCQKSEVKPVDSGYYSDTIQNYKKAEKDLFKNAFEVYMAEQAVIEKQGIAAAAKSENKGKDKKTPAATEEISISSAPLTAKSYSSQSDPGKNKVTSLTDDSTGVFAVLKPLVKENKVDEIIEILMRIEAENKNKHEVTKECYRKLALCYYVKQDQINYSKYQKIYLSMIKKEQELYEKYMGK